MGRGYRAVFVILGVVVLILLHFALSEGSQNSPTQESVSSWTLLDRVKECEGLLKNSSKLEFIEKKGKLTRKQIALCILDMETGDILERRYWLDQREIERANLLRKNYQNRPDIPSFTPVDSGNEFRVINDRWNNWNSEWSIERIGFADKVYAVVANKFLVPNSYIVYPEDRTGPKYSDIIYVPYSRLLHREEIVKIGFDYINEKVFEAFSDLRGKQVISRAFSGELVADTMSEKFIKEILVNEQTDPDALLNKAVTDEEKLKVLERVLVRYGLNGDKAFRYTVSKTGASGMAQLMATTYSHTKTNSGVVQKYPSAGLIRDINLGRLDPVNSIQAEILVLDDKLSEVKAMVFRSGQKAQKIFNSLVRDQLDEVMAMSYNGGSSKYDVNTGTLKTKARTRRARLGLIETRGFIDKLRVIRYLKLFT